LHKQSSRSSDMQTFFEHLVNWIVKDTSSEAVSSAVSCDEQLQERGTVLAAQWPQY